MWPAAAHLAEITIGPTHPRPPTGTSTSTRQDQVQVQDWFGGTQPRSTSAVNYPTSTPVYGNPT